MCRYLYEMFKSKIFDSILESELSGFRKEIDQHIGLIHNFFPGVSKVIVHSRVHIMDNIDKIPGGSFFSGIFWIQLTAYWSRSSVDSARKLISISV